MSCVSIEAGREDWAPLEQTSVAIPSVRNSRHHWAVLLAGGDGTRLQSLTLKIAGDSRPKQFCSILGGESLLTQTRARIEPLFHADRELFVVTRAHETYYRDELRNVDASCIIPQPMNRGTGVAVALALLHILERDAHAVVALLPCDHYYSDTEAFSRTVGAAISGAEQYPDSIILLGAEAYYPEIEYGWIEPGSAISRAPIPLLSVNQFWEKPSLPQARTLLRRGCLWNTFVTVGLASTFLDLLCSQVPDVVLSINKALAENELEAAYRQLPAIDLSRQILASQPHRLLAIRDRTSGWADLGSPSRVMDVLARTSLQPVWLRDGHSPEVPPSAGMAARSEISKALGQAFRGAFMLTGSTEVAENAVLDGIAASESGNISDHVLIVETAKSAIQRRPGFPAQSEQALSHFPLELQRLFLLAPIHRQCFVLRILLGMTIETCSRIVRLTIEQTEEMLCAALRELPFLETYSPTTHAKGA
jgi:mannose-1-phosphate guanylyltransferase